MIIPLIISLAIRLEIPLIRRLISPDKTVDELANKAVDKMVGVDIYDG